MSRGSFPCFLVWYFYHTNRTRECFHVIKSVHHGAGNVNKTLHWTSEIMSKVNYVSEVTCHSLGLSFLTQTEELLHSLALHKYCHSTIYVDFQPLWSWGENMLSCSEIYVIQCKTMPFQGSAKTYLLLLKLFFNFIHLSSKYLLNWWVNHHHLPSSPNSVCSIKETSYSGWVTLVPGCKCVYFCFFGLVCIWFLVPLEPGSSGHLTNFSF